MYGNPHRNRIRYLVLSMGVDELCKIKTLRLSMEYKYTKEHMDGIEKMLEWFHSKSKTEFKYTDERMGNHPLLIDATGQLIVDWMTRKVTQLEYDDRDKMLWNAIRELYLDNQKEGYYQVTHIVRK